MAIEEGKGGGIVPLEILKPVQFLDWKEAIEKLEIIEQKMRRKIKGKSPEILPAIALCLALAAERKVLGYLNDDALNCRVPWDETTGFPSPPSMSADAAQYGDYFETTNTPQDAILKSFSRWTLLVQEKTLCCCGKRNTNFEEVVIDAMLNHSVTIDENRLVVRQFFGVKSNNLKHMAHHYSAKTQSQRYKDLIIIWDCENQIDCRNFEISSSIKVRAEEFNVQEFQNRILTKCAV